MNSVNNDRVQYYWIQIAALLFYCNNWAYKRFATKRFYHEFVNAPRYKTLLLLFVVDATKSAKPLLRSIYDIRTSKLTMMISRTVYNIICIEFYRFAHARSFKVTYDMILHVSIICVSVTLIPSRLHRIHTCSTAVAQVKNNELMRIKGYSEQINRNKKST